MSYTATAIDNSEYNGARLTADADADAVTCVHLEIRPNGTSNRRALFFCAGVVVFVCLCIGIMSLALGAWPILPFAGAEALLLIAAVIVSVRSERVELLAISKNSVHVTVQQGSRSTVRSFSRFWTQAALVPGCTRNHRSRLLLVSHGRVQEIGSALIDSRKSDLYRQLTKMLN